MYMTPCIATTNLIFPNIIWK